MQILARTADYVVCVKPAGAASQGEGPADMPALLAAETGGTVWPVHRLDRAVGGVMVYARTKQAAAALSRAIQEGRLEKDYLAVLTGAPAEPAGTLRDLLYHDRFKNKTYVVRRPRNGVKEAVLDYQTLESSPAGTLVRVRLHTGRTHQIRVQFASRGCPLAGDGKYGGHGSAPALWSFRLAFPDPSSGAQQVFTCPPGGGLWAAFSALPESFPEQQQ